MKNILLGLALISKILCVPTPVESEDDDDEIIPFNRPHVVDASYAPIIVDCPSNNEAQIDNRLVSLKEVNYIEKRRPKNKEALLNFFKRTIGKEEDLSINLEEFIKGKNLTLGLSFSGSGYKSFFSGAGQLLGLDDRAESSSPLSGILQASSYIVGNNAGNWLVGSLSAHGFPLVSELFASPNKFDFNNSLTNIFGDDFQSNEEYWKDISRRLVEKYKTGFPVSPVDILGRALSYQLISKKTVNMRKLSSVAYLDTFKNFEMPYPLLTADLAKNISQYQDIYSLEMSPYRISAYKNLLGSSISTKYFGSYYKKELEFCFKNLDDLGFLMAIGSSGDTPMIKDLYDHIAEYTRNEYLPGFEESMFGFSNANGDNIDTHFLLDNSPFVEQSGASMQIGPGSNNKNKVELSSFFVPQRNVDVAFLFDNTEDNSTLTTYQAVYNSIRGLGNSSTELIQTFSNWIENSKLPAKAGFFGCNATNTPLLIYIPNGYYTQNVKMPYEGQVTFTEEEVHSLINNGIAAVSSKNNDLQDDDWSTCVACAMINHKLMKDGDDSKLPKKCSKCFKKYCINEMPEYTKEEKEKIEEKNSEQKERQKEVKRKQSEEKIRQKEELQRQKEKLQRQKEEEARRNREQYEEYYPTDTPYATH